MSAVSSKALLAEIRDLVEIEQAPEAPSLSDVMRRELEFQKWRLMHKYVHDRPFRTRVSIRRSEQWREAMAILREIGDPELNDWLLLQIEVARNIERGVRDLRPRKNGPCHPLVLEYVGNRKRKALAVLHFAKAAEAEGCYRVNSDFHGRTAEILDRYRLVDVDEAGRPRPTSEPMARS